MKTTISSGDGIVYAAFFTVIATALFLLWIDVATAAGFSLWMAAAGGAIVTGVAIVILALGLTTKREEE